MSNPRTLTDPTFDTVHGQTMVRCATVALSLLLDLREPGLAERAGVPEQVADLLLHATTEPETALAALRALQARVWVPGAPCAHIIAYPDAGTLLVDIVTRAAILVTTTGSRHWLTVLAHPLATQGLLGEPRTVLESLVAAGLRDPAVWSIVAPALISAGLAWDAILVTGWTALRHPAVHAAILHEGPFAAAPACGQRPRLRAGSGLAEIHLRIARTLQARCADLLVGSLSDFELPIYASVLASLHGIDRIIELRDLGATMRLGDLLAVASAIWGEDLTSPITGPDERRPGPAED